MSEPEPSTPPPEVDATSDPPRTVPAATEPNAADAGGALTPSAQQMADVAIADLAERIGGSSTDAATIAVVSVDEVTWRNGSLGCPAKGMQYTQVLTPGTRIVLVHEGVEYEYHAGSGRDPFYCAMPEAPLD